MPIVNRLRRHLAARARGLVLAPLANAIDRGIVLQALVAATANRQKQRIGSLAEVEFSAFSQWGEDGIIDWLAERLKGIPQAFVEFGVEDYRESNTRLLLQLRNWRGLVMDGSPGHVASIKAQGISWRYGLDAVCAFVQRENIDELIAGSGLSGEIGLLSIDIDGNDYWVWDAITAVTPAIVVCEYNAVFGDLHAISVPYEPEFQRTRAHFSNLYFGASLPALIGLGNAKGYVFLGTNSNGCNAFFVRKDLASVAGSIAEIKGYPSRFREARDESGALTLASGARRVEAIRHLPVYDCGSGRVRPLAEFGDLYSADWLRPY